MIDHKIENDRVFSLCLGAFPSEIDPRKIRTGATYLILRQLSRALTGYNQSGQLVGDLAEKWEFSNDFKTVRFWIKKDAYWSDGQPVTARDLEKTLNWLKESKQTVHFEMDQIVGLRTENNMIEINFSRPMPGFLHASSHPEFSPYDIKDGQANLTRTIGPFFIPSIQNGQLELQNNIYYNLSNGLRPKRFLIIPAANNVEATELLIKNKCDVAFIRQLSENDAHKLFETTGSKQHPVSIGFTFFAALAESKLTEGERIYLSNLLSQTAFEKKDLFHDFLYTQNLFLNDGPGRITKNQLSQIWLEMKLRANQIEFNKNNVIHILAPKNYAFGQMVSAALLNNGIKADLDFYENQDGYAEMSKTEKYHILINNNDYSSLDLAENLQVTFNSNRPLVKLGKARSHFLHLLSKLEVADGEVRSDITRTIGMELITRGYVTPLFHMIHSIYIGNELNSDDFSHVGFELPLHKLKINTKK